jgi:glycosyltransferase involved in cell wall biosynthesis
MKPVVYTAHGFHFWDGAPVQNWMLYFPLEWMLARLTDGLITINPEDHARASTFPVRPGGRVYQTSGVGVDLREAATAVADKSSMIRLRRELGVPPGSPVLLTVGELNANKNQRQVLRSMAAVVKHHPDVRWLIAGEGSERTRLEAEASTWGLAQHIRFLGFRHDIRDLVLVSDLLVSTSRREGLPLNVLEAMAASRPVVVSDTRGHRHLVNHGANGLVVGLDDHDATSTAILRLLDSPDEAAAMGRAGYRTAQAYSRAVVLEQMRDIYDQLLAEHDSLSEGNRRAHARGAYGGRD